MLMSWEDVIEQYSLYRWAAIAKVLEGNLNDLVQPEFDDDESLGETGA